MNITILKTTIAGLVMLTGVNVQAQYVGPNSETIPGSVKEVIDNPVDDQDVLLRGSLISRLSKDKYTFSDGSGEIRVEIDDDEFPRQPISESTVIEIYGEVEKDFLESPEIDVGRVRVIQ
ncbi:MAG: NirD/YgiW/YdeI family stress tolerance protein [Gammaproteobacteria bacterium]